MDSLGKTEVLISGGALLTAVGASWYLNGRINELEELLLGLNNKTANLVHLAASDNNKIGNIQTFNDNVRTSIENLRKDVRLLTEYEKKKDKIIESQHQAIMELQEIMLSLEGIPDLKYILQKKSKSKSKPSQKKSQKKGKKSERYEDSTSEEEEKSSSSESSDDDDIRARMNKV
jgi:hypothetical protein